MNSLFIMKIPSNKNHEYYQVNQVHQRQNAIYSLKKWWCVFDGIKKQTNIE